MLVQSVLLMSVVAPTETSSKQMHGMSDSITLSLELHFESILARKVCCSGIIFILVKLFRVIRLFSQYYAWLSGINISLGIILRFKTDFYSHLEEIRFISSHFFRR